MSASTRVEIAMPMAVRIDAIDAISHCGVFMKESPECLTDPVDLRVALFEERASSLACLINSISESTLSSFLIRS